MNYEKYYNADGQVAILYSPGYGAGWTTWCWDHEVKEALTFDAEIVKLLLEKKFNEIENYTNEKYEQCPLGLSDLEIMWLDPETPFRIEEYDGSESVRFYNPDSYLKA